MPIAAGSMNQRVQFLRRIAGSYQPLGSVQWARLQFERAVTISVVGVPFQGRGGKLTVRSCDVTRGLTTGDRLRMDGEEFAITIRKAAEVAVDDVHLEIESAPTPALYAAEMERRGEVVSLRRSTPNSTPARKAIGMPASTTSCTAPTATRSPPIRPMTLAETGMASTAREP